VASKKDLVINDLARFEKASERLVLEEYSSCEVPAGCGGGILRWIDPLDALPLHLRLWATGQVELFFDGAPLRSSRVDVRAGAHVAAIRVSPKKGAPPQLALAMRYSDETSPKGGFGPSRSRSIGRKIEVLSGAGATLRGTSKKPDGDAWKLPGFDDSPWGELSALEPFMSTDKDWHLSTVLETGARVVGPAGANGDLWVRCCFEVTLPSAPGARGGAP
jgi:hypothetical protein